MPGQGGVVIAGDPETPHKLLLYLVVDFTLTLLCFFHTWYYVKNKYTPHPSYADVHDSRHGTRDNLIVGGRW